MLKLVLVGVGDWSKHVHGPALAHYTKEHPGELDLAAVCVRKNVDRAREFCEQFGFQRVYTDLDEMLDEEKPDACYVVTPIAATRKVAGHVLERGVPLFLEKPPGANLQEAKELADISKRTGTPNMVGFNRRWAPCTLKALGWLKDTGPIEYIHSRMLRPERRDETFAFGTGIHLLDCVRALAEATVGGIRSARTTRMASAVAPLNFYVDMAFGSGAAGRCDILPGCGIVGETYSLFAAKECVTYRFPWTAWPQLDCDGRAELWVDGKLKDAKDYPLHPQYISSGPCNQAAELISALREGRKPSPSLEESVDSVALAAAVQEGREVEF
jgi:predicted dehydrogenase